MSRMFAPPCAVGLGLGVAMPAAGVDVNSNLSPLEVEDAEPADVGSCSLDIRGRFQRTDNGESEWLLQPQVKLGLARDMQLDVGTVIVGGQTREGRADMSGSTAFGKKDETTGFPLSR